MNGFSGKYYFHSLRENVGTYIREPGLVPEYPSTQLYLMYIGGYWYIVNDRDNGFFRLESEGLFNLHELYSEEI